MIFKQTIAILGGDTRQCSLATRLAKEGLAVRIFGLPQEGLPSEIVSFSDWREAIADAVAVVLPLPVSPDGIRLNLPLAPSAESVPIATLFAAIPTTCLLAGGKFSPAVRAYAEECGLTVFDYFKSEELQLKNALPTAEGAVSILMRECPRTVSGLSVGVTGFGRVSRALVRLLLAMNAEVTVAARKRADLKEAEAMGCKTEHLSGGRALSALCDTTEFIFNTVPHWIFSADILADMPRNSLIIDLASTPGGVDASAASANGIRVIWALSLPGKYAPATAGEIIAETLLSYMREEGLL
ncbi:MAG: dipicolinate synthase [Clostridia bacterium]|nr:dipicolinate synthase [Clostridia bacterium]